MKPQCRHCHQAPVSRPRGLCWACYYTPGVKSLYPSTSKHGAWADAPDRRVVPQIPDEGWFVVGTRADGDRVVLAGAASKAAAQRLCRPLAECEDYVAIDVEQAGKPSRPMAV